MEHIKDFNGFLNEGLPAGLKILGLKTASDLMDMHDKIFKKMKLTSADELYIDDEVQIAYIDAMNAAIEKSGLEERIEANQETIHDELEAENYHTLNSFLAMRGFMPKYKRTYVEIAKKTGPTRAFAIYLM